jgi:hypothetical protein
LLGVWILVVRFVLGRFFYVSFFRRSFVFELYFNHATETVSEGLFGCFVQLIVNFDLVLSPCSKSGFGVTDFAFMEFMVTSKLMELKYFINRGDLLVHLKGKNIFDDE